MKRIRVGRGKFVTITTEMAERVARILEAGLTRDQVRDIMATEPRHASGLMIGSPKPLGLARHGTRNQPKIAVGELPLQED